MNRSIQAMALAIVCLAVSQPRNASAEDTLRIGVINPFTGPQALYGEELTRGYEFAVQQANAKGGVLGRKIVLIRGDAATPQQGIAAVEQLTSRDNVDAFIGTYASAVGNTASDAAARDNKLFWDTNTLAAGLTARGLPNYIRSGTNGDGFAQMTVEAIVTLIAPKLGKQPSEMKVWLEHEDSIYGTTIAEEQSKLLKKAGVTILANSAHAGNAIDLSDAVLRARNAHPDVWVETGYVPDGNMMIRSARDQGFNPPVMLWVGTGDTSETLDAIGAPGLEGMLVVGYTRTDVPAAFGPGAKEYLDYYRANFHRDPIAPHGMAAYVGAQVMLQAIQAAGSVDAEKVRAAAAKMDIPLYSYATGYGVKFNDDFQNTRALPGVVQWQSGHLVTLFPAAATAPGAQLVNLPRK
jgi:branched-chain amino acid transport system substrate-binding protein